MSFVLLSSQFNNGLQSYSALLLSAIRDISTVGTITIANIRTHLETSQIQPFDNAAFDDFLTQLYSLELDTSLLTATEITLLNVIREYLDPPAPYKCCGVDTPSVSNTLAAANKKIGSGTWEHELQIQFDNTVTCDVDHVVATITPVGPAPAATVSPVTCNFTSCSPTKAIYSYLWIDFVADPSGQSYDITCDVRDSSGVTIASYIESLIIA